jgi:hypothetical protein
VRAHGFVEPKQALGEHSRDEALDVSTTAQVTLTRRSYDTRMGHQLIVRFIQRSCRHRFQKAHPIAVDLINGLAEEGGHDSLAHAGVGPVHLVGAKRAP